MKNGFFNVLLSGSLLLSTQHTLFAEVIASHARVAQAPPASPVTAGYFNLQNTAASAVALQSISCTHPAVSRCELHQSSHQHGQHHMQQAQLTLAASETKQLEPGGMHLMLWLTKPLHEHENIAVKLRFDSGQELAFTLPVHGTSTHENH